VQLGKPETHILGTLLGHPVLELLSPSLEVCRFWCAAPSFSIRIGEAYVVIESDWHDTRDEALDYHVLAVSRESRPKDIPTSINKRERAIISLPFSSVQIGAPPSPVHSIAVLERKVAGSHECVRYDAGLLFSLEDGRRFLLIARESIAGGLQCTTMEREIEEFLAEVKVRTVAR